MTKYARTSFFVLDRTEQNHYGVNPKVAARAPKRAAELGLVHGKTYMWCACGYSQNQPFCDGSHWKNSTYKPLMFKYDETKKGICACKVNKFESGPYCDGSHKRLDLDNLPEAGFNQNP